MAVRERRPVLYIVVPCYNEEKVLPITNKMFEDKIVELIKNNKINTKSRVLFVNDGSKDFTWNIIKDLSEKSKYIEGISLSRNRGHQNALLAGLMEVKELCDISISIDCDGQDDINAMNEMVDKYLEGYDVVYGVRSKRKTDTFFKKFTAESYYKVLNTMGAEVVYNHADYRLLSSKVLNELNDYKEVNLFLRGLISLVGFESTIVYYERKERLAGESHYPLRKMIALAVDGITSLSIKPIRIITSFGIIVALLSFIGVIYSLVKHFSGVTVQGWTSMTCIICFVSGIQLISLGVIGEYVGKTYLETKHRPRYIVSEKTFQRKG